MLMHCITLYLNAILLINFYSRLVLVSNMSSLSIYIYGKLQWKNVYDKQLKKKKKKKNENKISM